MNVVFVAAARKSIRRSERGVVGMIIKDTVVPDGNPITIYKEKDIPETLSTENKEQIKLAMKGNDTTPRKIVVYVLAKTEEDYRKALEYFEIKKVTWLCCPTVKTDGQEEEIVTWVRDQREGNRNKIKAVLPDNTADSEGIVNYATSEVTVKGKKYGPEEFCSRIAGLLAGTSYKISSTYAVVEEASECEKLDRDALDAAVDAGKLVLFYDGEKVKVARGVNSLTTVSKGKADPWKKIRVVETMDMMHDDLVLLAEDNYVGKYPNTYSNKCLLISAIDSYMKELERNGLIQDYAVELDVEKIKEYIIENKGVTRDEAEAMSDEEIKKQYTDEKVFMKSWKILIWKLLFKEEPQGIITHQIVLLMERLESAGLIMIIWRKQRRSRQR